MKSLLSLFAAISSLNAPKAPVDDSNLYAVTRPEASAYVAAIECDWYGHAGEQIRVAPCPELPGAVDILTRVATKDGESVNHWMVWREINRDGSSFVYGEC